MEQGKRYEELPPRFKLTTTEEEWKKKVKEYCISKGFSWVGTVANTVVSEHDYYEDLIKFYRSNKRVGGRQRQCAGGKVLCSGPKPAPAGAVDPPCKPVGLVGIGPWSGPCCAARAAIDIFLREKKEQPYRLARRRWQGG
jgi:hypothetical protein